MSAHEGRGSMGAQMPDAEEPRSRVPSQWLIVEHMPLAPGRALPAPADGASRSADEYADGDDYDDCDDTFGDSSTASRLPAQTTPRREVPPLNPAPRSPDRVAPTPPPLFAELDQFLAHVGEADPTPRDGVAPLDRLVAAERRQTRRNARRAFLTRLLVLSLIVAIVVVALMVVKTHLPHLSLSHFLP